MSKSAKGKAKFFIVQARMPMPSSITIMIDYAASGALYFLVSSMWLTVSQLQRKAAIGRPS